MRSMLVFILTAAGVVTLAAQSPMRPGRWAITIQIQMPDMPMQMPELKREQCITAEDLKRDPASGLPSSTPDAKTKEACKTTDYKVTGENVTWKVVCTGEQTMTGTGDMTFKGDSYTGVMQMTTPKGEMTMKMAGTRVGDCSK